MTNQRARTRRLIPLTLLILMLSACRFDGAMFRTDTRLTITAPEARADVELPLTVSWEFTSDEDSPASYALLLDHAPPPPGQGLDVLILDPRCRDTPDCARLYLTERGIFETTETSFTIDAVARRFGVPEAEQDFHELTVVLLDEDGRRIGESAWSVEFFVPRP